MFRWSGSKQQSGGKKVERKEERQTGFVRKFTFLQYED